MNWKDQTRYIIQVGDHNCTHRDIDSLNNPGQHKQPGLIAEMKIMGLKDAFIQVHGEKKIEFSRKTKNSGTRIDLIMSNIKECMSFEYVDMKMGFDHSMAKATYKYKHRRGKREVAQTHEIQIHCNPKRDGEQ